MLTNSRGSHDKKFMGLDQLAMRGRHYGISVILISQFFTKITPAQRNNADFLFIGRQNRASYEMIEEQLNNTELSKKEFLEMIRKSTSNYYFLIVNQSSNSSSDIKNTFGKFKVPM
jgi:hypothetical protein